MPTQTVSAASVVDVLGAAEDLTEKTGTFTVADVVERSDKSESTVRAAVATLLNEGAVARAEGRGTYRVVTTDTKPEPARVPEPPTGEQLESATSADFRRRHPTGSETDGTYHVYAYGANDQPLRWAKDATWTLATEAELDELRRQERLPVSAWTADGKRRAVKIIRVYVSGSDMHMPPVVELHPQELRKTHAA